MFKTILRFLFGYDVFISYARADASDYAAALEDELSISRLNCFRDRSVIAPGERLSRVITRALTRSSVMVLLVSEAASSSEWVAKEVKSFRDIHASRDIIPVYLTGAHDMAAWEHLDANTRAAVEGFVWLSEQPLEGPLTRPSPELVNSVGNKFRGIRRTNIAIASIASLALLFALLAGVAWSMRQAAILQTARAQEQSNLADARKKLADQAADLAEKEALRATKQEGIALDQRKKAEQQRQLAVIGQAKSLIALAKLLAERGEDLLAHAALCAIESMRLSPTADATGFLREQLTMLPRVAAILPRKNDGVPVAFSDDGQTLATLDHTKILLWDISTRSRGSDPQQPVAALQVEEDNDILDVRFIAGGQALAAVFSGDAILIQDIRSKAVVRRIPFDSRFSKEPMAQIAADGRALRTVDGDEECTLKLAVIGVPICTRRTSLESLDPERAYKTVLSTDGETVSVVDRLSGARFGDLWVRYPAARLAGPWHSDSDRDEPLVGVSPDGHWIAEASDTDIHIWDAKEGKKAFTLEATQNRPIYSGSTPSGYFYEGKITALSFGSKGQILAVASTDSTVRVWDLTASDSGNDPPELARLIQPGEFHSVLFSGDGRFITGANDDDALENPPFAKMKPDYAPVVVWEAPENPRDHWKADIPAVSDPIPSRYVAESGDTIHLWNFDTGEERKVPGQPISGRPWFFLPGRLSLVSEDPDGAVRLTDMMSGRQLARTHAGPWIHRMAVDAGHRLVTVNKDSVVTVLALDSLSVLSQWRRDPHYDDAIAMSPDGGYVALASRETAGYSGTLEIRRWNGDIVTPPVFIKDSVHYIAFSKDGSLLAYGGERGWATVCRFSEGRFANCTSLGIAKKNESLAEITFSADSRFVAVAGPYTSRVFDVATGVQVVTIDDLSHAMVGFSPDGKAMVALSDTHWAVRTSIWPPDIIRSACDRLPFNLPVSDWKAVFGNTAYRQTCPGLPLPSPFTRSRIN